MFTRTYPLIAGTQTETERGDVTVVDGSLDVLQHLLTEADDHQWMHIPQIVQPDGAIADWSSVGWNMEPAEPHIFPE